jgi:AcrR family transcriptional regulator
MNEPEPRLTRAERRRRTEERILDVARGMFAELGYDRSTIRAVAAAAEVDPALVMQYFGSKEKLFKRAVTVPTELPLTEDAGRLADLVADVLGVKLGERGGRAEEAVLRSMLTHPDTARQVRDSLGTQIAQAGTAIPGEDANLRAALMLSTLLGVLIARNLLELDALRDATPDRIAVLLRPCFHLLAEPENG